MASATVTEHEGLRVSRIPSFRALTALFVLSLRQQFHGWRLAILSLLFLLPGALAVLICLLSPLPQRGPNPTEVLNFAFLFNLIPHALAPLAALLCSAGIIRDEVEEQTLTYVLLRPLPRTAVYAIKLLTSLLTAALLACFFTVATLLVIALLTSQPVNMTLLANAGKIAAIFSLAQVVYCALFAFMALLMRRALLIGLVYIIFFEGLLSFYDTIARQMMAIYYFRVLVLRWLNPALGREWEIDLTAAPSSQSCVLILLGAGLALTVVGAIIFAVREFRMKTIEGDGS